MNRFPNLVIQSWLILTICFGFAAESTAGSCRPTNVSEGQVTSLLNGKADLAVMPDRAHAESLLERLLVRTRGMELSESRGEPRSHEVEAANQWIKKITESRGMDGRDPLSQEPSFVWLPSMKSSEGWAQKVRTSSVVGVKALGGGTNGVYRVTQVDNSGREFHSVFKPVGESRPVRSGYAKTNPRDFLRFLFHVREIRAESLYGWILQAYWRNGGIAPVHVPETLEVVLVHKGKSYGVGSLQKWAMGMEVEGVRQSDPTRFAFWRGTREWQEMESVVRVLDYIFGNSDRFPKKDGEEAVKNLFVEMDWVDGREILRRANLIDNGLGVPGHRDYTIDQIPLADHVPWALKKALHEVIGQEATIRQEQKDYFPREGLDDVFQRWQQVLQRYPL
ncbi:MAG: hypothetical protein H6624_14920 [Bdellovibrionaceae bacterium]|nr:hypothetical protein [Bdellovibrionales bacterium]MCB9085636.1 hypothetical protein [Pseudobdellovibrionaceae bacterium]